MKFTWRSCIIYFDHTLITLSQICSLTDHSLPNPSHPDHLLPNAHSPISRSPRSLAPWSLACSHSPGPWSSAFQLAPWSVDSSHQPCFGQTCSMIARSPDERKLKAALLPWTTFREKIKAYWGQVEGSVIRELQRLDTNGCLLRIWRLLRRRCLSNMHYHGGFCHNVSISIHAVRHRHWGQIFSVYGQEHGEHMIYPWLQRSSRGVGG